MRTDEQTNSEVNRCIFATFFFFFFFFPLKGPKPKQKKVLLILHEANDYEKYRRLSSLLSCIQRRLQMMG